MDDRKFARDEIHEEAGPYHAISGKFEAEKYDGIPMDTTVELTIDSFCITWDDRHSLMKDLAEVLSNYQI